MATRERRPKRSNARTATLVAAGAALLGTAALLVRRTHLELLRAVTGARHDEASGRGRPGVPASPAARQAGHETKDMRGGLMAKLALLLGAVAVCLTFAMVGLRYWITQAQHGARPSFTRVQTAVIIPPKPNLQRDPLTELANLYAGEDKLLGNYAYLDDSHTQARIPIDRAMALTIGQPLAPPP